MVIVLISIQYFLLYIYDTDNTLLSNKNNLINVVLYIYNDELTHLL